MAWVIAIAALLPPVIYSVYAGVHGEKPWLDSTYLQALMSSWTATVLGIGAGLPIALWINRLAQSDAAKAEIEKAQAEARAREDRILQIIEQELTDDLGFIESVIKGSSLRFHFDVARWQALSSGGDAAAIDDLAVLQRVARTYEQIDTLNVIAGQWLVVMTGQNAAGKAEGDIHSNTLWNLVIASGNDAMKAIKDTLPLVSGRRNQLQQL